jgi:hypothetical protein
MAKCLLALILFVTAALAQTPRPDPAFGSITGVVRNSVTRAPLADIKVQVGPFSATSDPQGQFSFQQVFPGRYWISVSDERRAGRGGVYALVTAGQQLSGVDIPIKLGGTISGRVVDDVKKPVAGASVLLLERRFEAGEMAYARQQTVLTGKEGEYRLERVPAERSYLLLVKKPLAAPAPTDKVPADIEKRERILVPAYYPASLDPQGAQPVTLAPDENRQGADIRMASAPSYCMDGALEVPGGAPLPSLTILEQQALVAGSAFAPVTVRVTPEGNFRACGFHPGEYQLDANNGRNTNPPPAGSVSGYAHVTITNHDASGVKLLARQPAAISGDAAWDPPPPGNAAEKPIRVGLTKRIDFDRHADEAGPPSGISGAFVYAREVAVPGSFTLDRVPVDDYQLEAYPLPAGCYLKAASYDGISVLHGLLRLMSDGAGGRLRLVLACDGGFLNARVTDREGNPVSHVSLYLMPAEAESAAVLSATLRQIEVENGWSGSARPLPPGKYLALACDVALDGTAEPILKLWRARSQATEVEIGPNATVQVTLQTAVVD